MKTMVVDSLHITLFHGGVCERFCGAAWRVHRERGHALLTGSTSTPCAPTDCKTTHRASQHRWHPHRAPLSSPTCR